MYTASGWTNSITSWSASGRVPSARPTFPASTGILARIITRIIDFLLSPGSLRVRSPADVKYRPNSGITGCSIRASDRIRRLPVW
jgi:hypothetical protein